ncbi:cholesterol 24-hydroxylase-like [Brachionus plicatilis]|uniref:Cholesterol 24-hydroxylase-like n=1 Tax=Brachionus plicatilis TaxID=10195 RepID=A0A3M7Q7T8_BRAPC|nr:cholesterol 24-hydroxylase-like [Brachionus plicatilis]
MSILIGSSFAFFGYKTLKIYLLRRKYKHIPGPKTKGILGFYLGNVLDIKNLPKNKIFPDLVADWVSQYGHVIKFQLSDRMVVFTINPEIIKDIFITYNFPKHHHVYSIFGFPLGFRFLGNGLVTDLDNQRWRHRRNLFNPSFHKQALMTFLEEFNIKSDALMAKLRSMADKNQEVLILDEANNMTMDVIASVGLQVGFSMDIDSINQDNNLKGYVSKSLEGFNKILLDPFLKFSISGWSYIKTYKHILKNLRDLGRYQILKRIESIKDGSYVSDDLITIMLKNNQNEEFEIEDLIDDFVSFFIAGQETTANVIAAAILEVGQKPLILKKIIEEIKNEIGFKTDLKFEDLTKLKYLNCVIKETLRKWSIVPFLSRKVDMPLKLLGFDIPVGSNIQTSSYVSGNCEEFFPNPTHFIPERFLCEKDEIKNYTYFPFSLGPRNCIGQNFAQIEAKVCLTKFFQNFDFELDPKQIFYPAQHTTISPAGRTK